ncbi:MAG: M24 family metallopeptidase [Candidatus Dormibacteraceae bacterium]
MFNAIEYLKKFSEMQPKSVAITRKIARQLRPGQSEQEIADKYYEALAQVGLKDHWYPILVYVGDSTSLPMSRRYHLPSAEVYVQENDIIILDCTPLEGTVWSNWAETFMVGDDEFYEKLINDSRQIVDKVYDFTASQAKTIGDIYKYAMHLIEEKGFTSLDPMGDVGHSIFQVPAGQTVDKTPAQDRLFIYPEHGDRPIENIISIEPQIGKKHPTTGKLYSVKIQKVFIAL